MSIAWVMEQDPAQVASKLVDASHDDPRWLAAFTGALESRALADQLSRFLGVWGLSPAEAARAFGISRQAVSKWRTRGVPADRLEMVADLAAATDLLVHYLELDRIPATVRRKAEQLAGRSLLDMVAAGDSRGVLVACRAMFDFSAVQG